MTFLRTSGFFSCATQPSMPPCCTHGGMAASSPVAPAVYAYISAVIGSPALRAASIFAIASRIFGQFFCPPALR